MKKTLLTLFLGLLIAVPTAVRADEGMWLLSLLGKNYSDMQKAGFKLTPEDIYSVNQSCIKDAIVGLGNEGSPFWHFGTGEIISDQGLMTTNHHCGYGKLQEHSTLEHDYLRDGFWAYSMDQELPNPGLTASVLIRMEDVTARVKQAVSDNMSEADRSKAIKRVSDEISKEAEEGTIYQATVKPMFNGNQYFLFVHIIYKDVRLVGAPPSSMGKFGGDTDNWSWPRHTCDFSMFRIYTGPDGNPAAYSKDNIPLKPKHHLPVSIKEVKDGDYAMVLGFPGTTNRFLTSYGLGETMSITNKLRYEIRTVKINVLREEMAADQEVKIKYASKYASCSNYWKYSDEQNKALKALNTMGVKKEVENEYTNWSRNKAAKYGNALPLIKKGYDERAEYQIAKTYLNEGLLNGTELPNMAYKLGKAILEAREQTDQAKRDAAFQKVRKMAEDFYKDFDPEVEKHLMAEMWPYVVQNLKKEYLPEMLKTADRRFGGHWDRCADNLFSRTVFCDKETFMAYLSNPRNIRPGGLRKDVMFRTGEEFNNKYNEVKKMVPQESAEGLTRGIRDFTDGILQINEGRKLMAPDANSTIRCTYGNVKAYEPRDGVTYSHYTTLKGVIQKEDPTNSEFMVPARLKELYAARDFGQYANAKGELPTCFITNNDITGGNSGSPVIDAQGNLIGLAFDGNGEAMSGDIDFEENLQRCICLDTRYMLWVIDKYAGATNLIREMTIVK